MSSTINTVKERFIFRSMKQGRDKLDVWIKQLEKQANYCDFADIEDQIRDQIIEKTSCGELRRRALYGEMKLKDIIRLARLIEEACNHCGASFHRLGEKCQARNMVCRVCGVMGHIEKCCPEFKSGKRPAEVPTSTTTACKRIKQEPDSLKVLEDERKYLDEKLKNADSSNSTLRSPSIPKENLVSVILSGIHLKAIISDNYSVNVINFKFMKEMKMRFLTFEKKEFAINGHNFTGVVDLKVERVDRVSSMMDFYVTNDIGVSCIITSYNAKKLKLTSNTV